MTQPDLDAMAASLPITTDCYSDRVCELTKMVQELQQQLRNGNHSEDMDALLNQQIRSLSASLWALHAELEQD